MESFVAQFYDDKQPPKHVLLSHDIQGRRLLGEALSLRTGRKLRWDPEKEEIIGDADASRYLERPYRKPWDQVLRSFKL